MRNYHVDGLPNLMSYMEVVRAYEYHRNPPVNNPPPHPPQVIRADTKIRAENEPVGHEVQLQIHPDFAALFGRAAAPVNVPPAVNITNNMPGATPTGTTTTPAPTTTTVAPTTTSPAPTPTTTAPAAVVVPNPPPAPRQRNLTEIVGAVFIGILGLLLVLAAGKWVVDYLTTARPSSLVVAPSVDPANTTTAVRLPDGSIAIGTPVPNGPNERIGRLEQADESFKKLFEGQNKTNESLSKATGEVKVTADHAKADAAKMLNSHGCYGGSQDACVSYVRAQTVLGQPIPEEAAATECAKFCIM